MKINRTLVCFFLAVITFVSCTSSNARLFMSDKIDVTIKVQDESGKPIAYVTVWQFVNPDIKHISEPLSWKQMEDLWRVTQRYKATSEFVLEYGERPTPGLYVPEMSNSQGVVKHTFKYQEFTGGGDKYSRPDPTNFGYTFIKQGYLPEKLEFNVPSNKSSVEAIVTLKRDPNEAIETAPYIQTYERLRFELSDELKNEEMTAANQQRISRIEKELEAAAQQAIAAGDNKAAARIYIRMRYLPTITLQDGITGYSHVNRESTRSKRAWELAKQLDPDNLFIQIHTIYEHGDNRADLPLKDWQKSMTAHMDAFIAKHELTVWPAIYDARARFYKLIGEAEKSKQLFLEAAALEPKYKDWSKEKY
jgi:tetratricopeptide (TPR) repeat protein